MKLTFYQFETLSLQMLYAILSLRQRVFVIEQQSIYTDLDGLDQYALHLCVQKHQDTDLIGYTRLQLDKKSKIAKIERVVIDKSYRGKGIGNQLIQACIDRALQHKMVEIKLSAQVDVIPYYKTWGFVALGDVYDDGGIDHQDMLKTLD